MINAVKCSAGVPAGCRAGVLVRTPTIALVAVHTRDGNQ